MVFAKAGPFFGGNSLAVRLPDAIVKALKLKSGDEIEIVVTGERAFEVQRDKSRERALARLRALKKPLPVPIRSGRGQCPIGPPKGLPKDKPADAFSTRTSWFTHSLPMIRAAAAPRGCLPRGYDQRASAE